MQSNPMLNILAQYLVCCFPARRPLYFMASHFITLPLSCASMSRKSPSSGKFLQKSFPVPIGTTPTVRFSYLMTPLSTSLRVPSPPQAISLTVSEEAAVSFPIRSANASPSPTAFVMYISALMPVFSDAMRIFSTSLSIPLPLPALGFITKIVLI